MAENKPLILIVDDVPVNVSILSDALADDYRIKVANSGQTALTIAQRLPHPDLILLDVMMPEMDGFEVCRRLKMNDKTKKIPVIFITAKDGECDEMLGFDIGAIDYISKPFSLAITKMRIKQHLQRVFQERKLEQEIREHKLAQEGLIIAGLVYNTTSEGMVLTDKDNRIIAVNPAFTHLTGYSFEEVKGKDPKILNSNLQDDTFYQSMWHSLETTGAWSGEIWNRKKNGEAYAEHLTINTIYDEQGKVHQRVALFSDITQKKKTDEIIWQQANYDSLTNLPNRRLFQDRLKQAIKKAKRDDSLLTLFFIDLDHFKEINDTKGHDVGDWLLVEASKRLVQCVREIDTVARLGGDEFTIIFEALTDKSQIERIAKTICKTMEKPFVFGGEPLYISTSIGITFFPDDADDVTDLIKNADQAMYLSKEQGRNQYNYFVAKMQEEAQSRLSMTNDLHTALVENQFKIHFQPIIDMNTGIINKAEALLRWEHPKLGLIFPEEFIPLAEETGLIVEIGDWLFSECLKQTEEWKARFNRLIKICVNVSAVQFVSGNKSTQWIAILKEMNVSGQNIIIELNENFLLHATDSIMEQLKELKSVGIQFAIDDFGTGYTTLSCFKKIEIDYLKIHQSFIQNLSKDSIDLTLSKAIIVMAHKLNYEVIAGGVETVRQKQLLLDANCEKGQGFLFSKALPSEKFEMLLTHHG